MKGLFALTFLYITFVSIGAYVALSNVPLEVGQTKQTRYVQLDDKDELATVSFALNSISKKSQITLPALKDNIAVFFPEDYGIEIMAWDMVFGKKPVPVKDFIKTIFTTPTYRFLLGIEIRSKFYELIGHDPGDKVLSKESFIGVNGIVARSAFGIDRYHSGQRGYLWVSNYGKDDVSYLGSLPNGLLVYYITGGDYVLDYVPVDIAIDHLAGKDKRVHLAKSCIICHNQGIRDFAPMFISSSDKIRIEKIINTDKESYQDSVKLATQGLTSLEVSKRISEYFKD
jgi:hypothetical protein